MQVAAEALKELCAKRRHLGALPGILAVLHTWNGRLGYHPHVRLLVTGGGITPDGQHWEPARGEFLVPVAVLSRKIAAKFRDALQAKAPAVFAAIPTSVWQRQWVSFVKHYGHGTCEPIPTHVGGRVWLFDGLQTAHPPEVVATMSSGFSDSHSG
jgi:hypothetical protein